MIITFRFFFSNSIKKRLENSKTFLNVLSNQLMKLWEESHEAVFFFGIFNEMTRLDKLEFYLWDKNEVDSLVAKFEKPWDAIMVSTYSQINQKSNGDRVEGYFADIKLDSESGQITIVPLDDLYPQPTGDPL